ncbi:hypothetical protein HN126_000454 [Neisseria gonorrhoeae]
MVSGRSVGFEDIHLAVAVKCLIGIWDIFFSDKIRQTLITGIFLSTSSILMSSCMAKNLALFPAEEPFFCMAASSAKTSFSIFPIWIISIGLCQFFDKALPKLPSKIVLKTIIRYSKSFFVYDKAFLGGLSSKYVRYIELFGV